MHRYRNLALEAGALVLLLSLLLLLWHASSGHFQPRDAPNLRHPESNPPAARKLSPEEIRKEALCRSTAPLDWARQQSRHLAEDALRQLANFVARAKRKLPAFADDVLAWPSKWRFLTDQVPFVGTERAHAHFVVERFAERVFSPDELKRFLNLTMDTLAANLCEVECQMLTLLRQDLAELPWEESGLGAIPDKLLKAFSQELHREAIDVTDEALRTEVLQVLVSCLVTQAVVSATPRLSASLLGSGAAISRVGLGPTLLIGVAVDYVVARAWEALADPRGECVRRLEDQLDELHANLVEGTNAAHGLRERLERLLGQRERVRQSAVQTMLHPAGGER